jgi:phage/plasmid-like protein (TIGR03299 family)|tara:strand:+ start:3006 stop:3968 length:963 start_codon:yes stop_codon:yes gene_type:complete
MAHMIEVIDGVANMAYVGQTPWHGLGTELEEGCSPQEILEAANLNWKVEKQAVFTQDTPQHKGQIIPGKQALVRTSDNSILDIVGTDWHPVQNETAFDFFNDFVNAGEMTMNTAGSLYDGKKVWALAKTTEAFDLFGGDVVESYLLFCNSHQYGKSVDIRFVDTRVVCNNTLTLALGEKTKRALALSHRCEFDIEQVQMLMGINSDKLQSYKEIAQFLGSKKAKPADVREYLDNVFPIGGNNPKRERSRNSQICEEILDTQPGAEFAQGTWWQPFNAVTFMTDHLVGRSQTARLDSAWFGSNAKLKSRALDTAVKYAEAA